MHERFDTNEPRWWAWGIAASLCLALVPFGSTALAQDSGAEAGDTNEAVELEEENIASDDTEEEEAGQYEERLTVTGSRIARDAFTSITPIQVIDAEISRQAGSIDAADILQESTVASGQQIDLTFGGGDLSTGLEQYTLEDGPGSSTINLRGLKPDRTLVLINGRRLAPSGVEGAPANPDLNMIVPGSLIQRFEILLDGASAIYGSDAIAGVANVILRTDFDGLEFDSFVNVNQSSGKMDRTITMTWGRDWDNGFVGVGSSWSFNPPVLLGDTPFNAECETSLERDEHGNIRTKEISVWETELGMKWGECAYSAYFEDTGNWILSVGAIPYLFPTPDYTNVNIPGFSVMWFPYALNDAGTAGWWMDGDGDGYNDVSLYDQAINGKIPDRTLYPEFERKNLMGYGQWRLGGVMNLSPYFEFQIGSRSSHFNQGSGHEIFRTRVPGDYPHNMCNPAWENGVDCVQGLIDVYQNNADLNAAVIDYWGGSLSTCNFWASFFGYPDCYAFMLWPTPDWEPGTGLDNQPVWSVKNDRTITEAEVTQRRMLGGLRFDLPMLDRIPMVSGWEGDLSLMTTVSNGDSSRPGIREDRMAYALGWYNRDNIPCQADEDWESDDFVMPFPIRKLPLTPDVTAGCVPVYPHSPSLYVTRQPTVAGEFSSAAETNYLFDTRDMETDVYQDVISLYFTGGLFELPGGTILSSFGAEYRKDEIRSQPDRVAEEGLFYNFLSDRGAFGARDISEAYIELELPVFGGGLLRDELTLNVAGRTTNDEFFDTATTWSAKVAYRPHDSLMIRGVRGTSFRTPNLRNLFLGGATSSIFVLDYCFAPWWAYLSGQYNANNDNRSEEMLENCRNDGVDPLRAYVQGGAQWFLTPVHTGGTTELNPETSDSESVGLVFEQPWTDAFELTLSYSYYKIAVRDTIIEPTWQFIMYDCYGLRPGDPEFCDRVVRPTDLEIPEGDYTVENTYQPNIERVMVGFINRDNEKTRGFDFNMNFRDQHEVFGKTVRIWMDVKSHRLLDRESKDLTLGEDASIENETTAQWGYNRWKHRIDLAGEVDSWRLLWSTRVLSPISDQFEEFWDTTPWSDTCVGPPADVRCRDIGDAPRYFVHSASINYSGSRVRAGVGLANILNQAPPKIDYTEGPQENANNGATTVSNHPLGVGYDFLGRAMYVNFSYSFNGYN